MRFIFLLFFSVSLILKSLCQSQFIDISNEEMMTAIQSDLHPEINFYINDQRVKILEEQLKNLEPGNIEKQISARFILGSEYLLSGQSERAIDQFKELDQLNNTLQSGFHQISDTLNWMLATAYLRLGEQQNCLEFHNPNSCIFPLKDEGRHVLVEGSKNAIDYILNILKKDSLNLKAKWLLNLAHMTLGEYPAKIPGRLLIHDSIFQSSIQLPRFNDIAHILGVDHNSLSGGSVIDDFNGDDYMDVVVTSWDSRVPMKIFLNDKKGSFFDHTKNADLDRQLGGLNLIHADYDNDGDNDLFVLRGAWLGTLGEPIGNHPNSLLRNDGTGKFTDITIEAGLRDLHPVHSGVWADFDLDGYLDLFLGNESAQDPDDRSTINVHRYQLFKNNMNGTFNNIAQLAGIDDFGFVKGVAAGDIDNDGDQDIYISRLGQRNQLFRNDIIPSGQLSFEEIAEEANVDQPLLSFPTWFWDFDNDGWEDIFVASYTSFFQSDLDKVAADYLGLDERRNSRLYRNLGNGTFEDVTIEKNLNQMLLAMGANFGDIDNDGYLDLYIGTGQPALISLVPNRIFKNDNGGYFHDVTTTCGLGHLQKGHGISFADWDNDGDQDIYAVMGGAYSGDLYRNAMFENPGFSNSWVRLKLIGSASSNKAAIGARIKIQVKTETGERKIYKTVNSGGSFGSNPYHQLIGLGKARKIKRMTITWPDKDKSVQIFKDIPVNEVFQIVQGDPEMKKMELEKLNPQIPDHKSHRH